MKRQKGVKKPSRQREWVKGRITHYKPSTIRAEAEQDYRNYKQSGQLRQRSPEVVKNTIKAVLIIIVVTLILAISSIIVAIVG
ncbi:hypothetical protein ACHWP0_07810 [Weissella cibaria]|uniref:hypothetical protein n=1 Tax=Weissella cibaria TaxID=137591 RepID=UPI00376EAD69